MNWFKCNECGELIREDDLENRVVNSEPPFREYAKCCPVCHSDDLDQIETCPLCGTPNENYKHSLCGTCRTKTKRTFAAMVNILFDDRYGEEGTPGKNKDIVEAIFDEVSGLMEDTDFSKQLTERSV